MATHEQELKEAKETLALVLAELDANMEELAHTPVVSDTETLARPMRVTYLRLRNDHLRNHEGKLQERIRSKQLVIEWEERTR